ncbi:SRPBCC family protein [Paraburkholderia sp.]|uniref:SRPBCC family protein n=1 Tax=Paraburkholderia sp. TaxID=1926495 RepID=UPI0025D322DC|nr:SRPBCC family protein [Paraburkholderia sp.]
MAQASASIEIPVSPDIVWQLIGGFNSLPDWLPYIPSSESSEGGRVRRLANPNGETIVERLEAFDNRARSYTYSILEAPFPVTGYCSTLHVKEVGGGRASQVDWSGEFTPDGVDDEEASRLFEGIYRDGLQALATLLAGKARA